MREYDGELAGRRIVLAANFAASQKIAKKVGDPLTIAREAMLEHYMLSMNIVYEPKWRFTIENIPEILHIGLEAAGERITMKDVQEWVFEAGFAAARDVATDYLALLVGPQPEKLPEKSDDSSGEQLGLNL